MSNTFEPSFDLIQEEDCNTLLLYLPGFTKEQLRVQLSRSKELKISGSRPIGDNKWSTFQKDFPVPDNCDSNKISAKFEEGILYIRQPKLIVPEQQTTPQPLPPPRVEAPPPPPKADQEQIQRPTTPPNHGGSNTTAEKKPKEEAAAEGGGKDEREGKGSEDEKATRNCGDQRDEKASTESKSDSAMAAKVDGYSYSRVMNAAGRLKVEREKVMKILLFLFAFALGMYITNLPWFSAKVDN